MCFASGYPADKSKQPTSGSPTWLPKAVRSRRSGTDYNSQKARRSFGKDAHDAGGATCSGICSPGAPQVRATPGTKEAASPPRVGPPSLQSWSPGWWRAASCGRGGPQSAAGLPARLALLALKTEESALRKPALRAGGVTDAKETRRRAEGGPRGGGAGGGAGAGGGPLSAAGGGGEEGRGRAERRARLRRQGRGETQS